MLDSLWLLSLDVFFGGWVNRVCRVNLIRILAFDDQTCENVVNQLLLHDELLGYAEKFRAYGCHGIHPRKSTFHFSLFEIARQYHMEAFHEMDISDESIEKQFIVPVWEEMIFILTWDCVN